jgi:hypothetical protein
MGTTIGADVSEELKDRIDEYRADDESRSAAVERLVRIGLESETTNRSPTTVHLLLIVGSLTLGIAIEPVAAPGLFVAAAIGALLLAAGVERGVL